MAFKRRLSGVAKSARTTVSVTAVLTLLVVSIPLSVGAASADAPLDSARIPGEVVVFLDSSASASTLGALSVRGAVERRESSPVVVIRVAPGTEREVIRQVEALPGVIAAGENLVLRPHAIPNDPLYGSQWGLHQIEAAKAHDQSKGQGVVIAVIDSGVAYQAWSGGGAAGDLTCKAVKAPKDFSNQDSLPDDEIGHGTAVAAVALGCSDDSYGAAGVAPQASLMPLKVCTPSHGCPLSWVVGAIVHAADHGASVMNISLGGEYSEVLDAAVLYAVDRDVAIVASSGNSGGDQIFCPACLPEVVAVGATTQSGSVASYSTGGVGLFGKRLDLVAPGGEGSGGVLAETYEDYCNGLSGASDYTFRFIHCTGLTGTSFASPHAAGVGALIRSVYPMLHSLAVGTAVRNGAVDIGPSGWDSRSGWGHLSAPRALAAAAILATPDSVGVQEPGSGSWSLRGLGSFFYGNPADIPISCDWTGDGVDTPGLYRSTTGFLHLRNSNTQGVSDTEIFYGVPSDLPVCGDWDGDGVDTIGIYRPSEARFYLRNSNTQGVADIVFEFGNPGDKPFAGDWDGDGVATVGLHREETGQVYITNTNSTGVADFDAFYGDPGDRFVVGDWDGDGRESFGIFRPSESTFYLSNTIGNGIADIVIAFGAPTSNPIAGKWR